MPPLAQPAAPTTTGEATLLKFRSDSGTTFLKFQNQKFIVSRVGVRLPILGLPALIFEKR